MGEISFSDKWHERRLNINKHTHEYMAISSLAHFHKSLPSTEGESGFCGVLGLKNLDSLFEKKLQNYK
jgi:hypothetical protein